MKIYLDTSVIGGCIDPEFSEASQKLIDDIRLGMATAVVSDLTLKELESAPEEVRAIIDSIPAKNIVVVELSDDARSLALRYISEGVVARKHLVDA